MTDKNKLFLIITLVILALAAFFFVNSPKNDDAQIKAVLQEEIPTKTAVKSFEVVSLSVKDNFAKAIIKPLDVETDNAFVILEKKELGWEVIWGPGTDMSPEDPLYKMLPTGLLGF